MSLLVGFFWHLSSIPAPFWVFTSPWVPGFPGFYSSRFFFHDVIRCNAVLFGGNVCSPLLLLVLDVLHAYLNSCHRYQQCTKLLHVVTSCKCQLRLCHVMSPYIMSHHVLLSLAHPGFLRSGRLLMDSSETEDSSSESNCECAKDGEVHSWDARPSMAINRYAVSLRREQEVCRCERGRLAAFQRRQEEFLQTTSSLRWKSSPSWTPRKPTI